MPTHSSRGGRITATASLHTRVNAVIVTVLLLAASALVGAPAAQALPKGAYWYTLLDLPKAWKISEGAGVTVAVIDGGVQADLGDLKGQVLRGLDLTGADPGAQQEQPATQASQFGHGTDMAAVIAGTGKGAGMVGVAPKAKILPVDALSSGSVSDADIARGIIWSVDHGAKVVNVSLGARASCSSVVEPALKYAFTHDVPVVVSAGDAAGPVYSPANCPGALAVSGVDAAVKPWTNSASGPETDFVAPAYRLVNDLLNNTLDGPNQYDNGTSAAAAMVSGTLALLRSKFPHDTARQIITRALYNVHNGVGEQAFGTRVSNSLGYGMILPRFALTEAAPADASNPIYDSWARAFGSPSTSPSSGSVPAASPASGASSVPGSGGATSTPIAAGGGSNGVSPVLVVLIAVVVVGLVVVAVVIGARRRRPRGPSGFPPPGGYRR